MYNHCYIITHAIQSSWPLYQIIKKYRFKHPFLRGGGGKGGSYSDIVAPINIAEI